MMTLQQSPIAALRAIDVVETEEAIELSGTVRSFYHKQLAQSVAATSARGREIINNIHVHKPQRSVLN